MSERFRRADAIFDAALDLHTGERAAYVEGACAGDGALREAVARLLRAHDRSGGFLSEGAARVAEPLLEDDGDILARLQRALGGGYRVERRLARGGMAVVFLATDLRHDRPVAVKVLDPALGAAFGAGAERFLAEIRVTARLHHPNLLPLFDSGAAEGLLFYVMPFVDGETLRERLRRESPLPVDEAVRIARAVAGALEHAHAHGVVHRDLKPENILMQAGHPLVADFGIALALSSAGSGFTRAGFTQGTPQYMAPEQAEGGREVDARADVYSLGAVLYEMLTGEVPHAAGSAHALLARRRTERPTPVRIIRDSVPGHVALAVSARWSGFRRTVPPPPARWRTRWPGNDSPRARGGRGGGGCGRVSRRARWRAWERWRCGSARLRPPPASSSRRSATPPWGAFPRSRPTGSAWSTPARRRRGGACSCARSPSSGRSRSPAPRGR